MIHFFCGTGGFGESFFDETAGFFVLDGGAGGLGRGWTGPVDGVASVFAVDSDDNSAVDCAVDLGGDSDVCSRRAR